MLGQGIHPSDLLAGPMYRPVASLTHLSTTHRLEHFPTPDRHGGFHRSVHSQRSCPPRHSPVAAATRRPPALLFLTTAAIHRRAYLNLTPHRGPSRATRGVPHRAPIHLTHHGHGVHRAITNPVPPGGGHRRSKHRLPRSVKDIAAGRGGRLRLGVCWAVALDVPLTDLASYRSSPPGRP